MHQIMLDVRGALPMMPPVTQATLQTMQAKRRTTRLTALTTKTYLDTTLPDVMNWLKENWTAFIFLSILGGLILLYGFLFQQFTFLGDGRSLFRCSNVTGECNRFSPASIELSR